MVSFQSVPVDRPVVGAVAEFLMPIGLKLEPSYTLSEFADLSYHNSPVKGADGAVVEAEFSNSFTRFSLNGSP